MLFPSTSEPKKVQQCQFQTEILFLMGVQKLYGPRNFTIFTVYATIFGQFMAALWQFFSNYIKEIDHFTLDLLKRSDT